MMVLHCRTFNYQEKYHFFEIGEEKVKKIEIPADEES